MGEGWHETVWLFETPIIATFLASVVLKTPSYCKIARHILRNHTKETKNVWYQGSIPSQGNVVSDVWDVSDVWHVFHCKKSLLINEWQKAWNSWNAHWTQAAVMLGQQSNSLFYHQILLSYGFSEGLSNSFWSTQWKGEGKGSWAQHVNWPKFLNIKDCRSQ